MGSDPEKADQNKSLWEEVKVTGVKFNLDLIFMSFRVSNIPTYVNQSQTNFLLIMI